MALRDFKLQNLSRTTQIVLFAAIAIGITSLGYVLYLKDLIQQRSTLRVEIRQLEISVAQATAVQSQIERFKEELALLDQRLMELRRILPDTKETPQILRTVLEMASTSNLKIIKFDPQPVAPHDFYSDWPITVEVQGSYNALGLFFEKIGRFTRIVNVDNIKVKGIDGSTDPSRTLTSNCTATTFVFREEPVAVTNGN
jgi:type IV pilus assembly protein PilO